jgi:hypothetical protein
MLGQGGAMPSASDLDFYRRPGPITDICARHVPTLAGLAADPAALAEVVRGVLVHRDWAPLMGLSFDASRLADQQIRPIDEVLDRIQGLAPGPIARARPAGDRMVGVCRHFAVLHVALLRHFGVPGRARAGFGGYFTPSRWEDHWITEWWDGARWVRHDAQIGPQARELLSLHFDPADQPAGRFLTGAEAWLLCRAGQADADVFGIFDIRGLDFVYADLLLDLAALNKVELLPWDALAFGHWPPDEEQLAKIDRLAEVVRADELSSIRAIYAGRPVPKTITTLLDGVRTPAHLGRLVRLDQEMPA